MKKVFILFIVLVALGNLVFADVAFGAWGRTIFNVAQGSNVNSDISQSWGPGWNGNQPRFGVDFKFTSKFVDYAFNFRMNGAAYDTIPTAYGTLKLIPDMFSLHIGKFSGDGWDTFRKTSPHPINDKNNGNVGRFDGVGLIAAFAPKDTGFEAGIMWATDGFVTDTIQDNVQSVDLAAAYTLPSLLKITAGSTVDGFYPTATRNIFARVELLMVKDLTLWIDGKYDGLEDDRGDLNPLNDEINGNDAGENTHISSVLGAGYTMDKLSIAFAASLTMYSPKSGVTGDSQTAWGAYPEVYYNLGAVTVGLFAGLDGRTTTDSGLKIEVEPYIVVNDFNLRLSFDYVMNGDFNTTTSDYSWAVPITVTFGF